MLRRKVLKVFYPDDLQRGFVRRFEIDHRSHAVFKSLLPARHAKTPLVAVLNTRKIKLRHRRRKVIADRFRISQKLICRYDANRVAACVVGSRAAIAVTIKACHRVGAAAFQVAAEDVFRFWVVAVAVCYAHLTFLFPVD